MGVLRKVSGELTFRRNPHTRGQAFVQLGYQFLVVIACRYIHV